MHCDNECFDRLMKELGDDLEYESALALATSQEYHFFSRMRWYSYIRPHVGSIVNKESVGLGDTIAKITHATSLDKLAELYTKITGRQCGCQGRQEALNKLFPYGITESPE